MDFKTEQVIWREQTGLTEYESSADIRRGFCSHCGSTVSFRSVSHEQFLSLAITTLDSPEEVQPTYHIFTDHQLPWHQINDHCERYAQAK
jgi:hypothetical protein